MNSGWVMWVNGVRHLVSASEPRSEFNKLAELPGCEWHFFDRLDSDEAIYWNPGQKPKEDVAVVENTLKGEHVHDVWQGVLDDMHNRRLFGYTKYQKFVDCNDDEDWLQHWYEELLDAAVYAKARIIKERQNKYGNS